MADNQSTESERPETHPSGPKQGKVEYLPAIFLVAALVFLPTGPKSGSLNTLAIALDSDQTEAFANDQWVQVEGTFELRKINGKLIPIVLKTSQKEHCTEGGDAGGAA